MPRPPPIRCHEFLSAAVACASRGYQANGAAMVRPSASSTDRVSSLTTTRVARASRVSTTEELIPTLQKLLPVLVHQLLDAIDVLAAEATAAFEADGVEPELGLAVVAFDVDVWRLAAVTGVEEEPER